MTIKKIRIFKPHTHAGVRYDPGSEGVEIEVSEPDAKFIQQLGLDKPTPKPATEPSTTA